jgi:hypothetical protein
VFLKQLAVPIVVRCEIIEVFGKTGGRRMEIKQ